MPGDEQRDQTQDSGEQQLDLNKETLKDLDADAKDEVKGGMMRLTGGCGDFPMTAQTACNCA